ncbi:MAG: hypothetical protein IPO98_09920 [Saprospiraceae bacterium]|nr:hypothetical protein [Saprospiraceae bacterium]
MHIKRACELGSIGLHALRPDGLVKYMNENKNISFKNDEDKVNYFIYKTWLIAMMSKKQDLSQIKNLKDEIHLMTNEEFGYFSTLLKFDYAYLEKQS